MTKVGLMKGEDRFINVFQALVNAGEEVKQKIHGKVLIEVNTVMKGAPLANTHPEALRAILFANLFNRWAPNLNNGRRNNQVNTFLIGSLVKIRGQLEQWQHH